jgi:hypothetical protein
LTLVVFAKQKGKKINPLSSIQKYCSKKKEEDHFSPRNMGVDTMGEAEIHTL